MSNLALRLAILISALFVVVSSENASTTEKGYFQFRLMNLNLFNYSSNDSCFNTVNAACVVYFTAELVYNNQTEKHFDIYKNETCIQNFTFQDTPIISFNKLYDGSIVGSLRVSIYRVNISSNITENLAETLMNITGMQASYFNNSVQYYNQIYQFSNGITFSYSNTVHCSTNYYGSKCDIYCKSTDRFDCASNGAKICNPNYQGLNCDVKKDPCNPNPCDRNGNCTKDGLTYNCSCIKGYGGVNCYQIIDYCYVYKIVCPPYYACINTAYGYGCACPLCVDDINECVLNSSTICSDFMFSHCVNIPGSYRCDCNSGVTGDRCHIVKDYCASYNPCQEEKQQCRNVNEDKEPYYKCVDCPSYGIYQIDCQTDSPVVLTQKQFGFLFYLGIGIGAFVLLLVALLIVICCWQRRFVLQKHEEKQKRTSSGNTNPYQYLGCDFVNKLLPSLSNNESSWNGRMAVTSFDQIELQSGFTNNGYL